MKDQTNSWNLQVKKNTINLMYWTIAWTLTVALTTFGPRFVWESDMITLLSLGFNIGLGIGMIWANKRHLSGLDELQRKIQQDAMALTLGVGLVFGIGYNLLDTTNLISTDAEISYLIMLMSITYIISAIIGYRKYK